MTKKIPQLQQYETLIYIEKSRQKTLDKTNQFFLKQQTPN